MSVSITLFQVLAVGLGSTHLNNLKVDVPVPDVELSQSPPIAVLDLWLERDGLALNQSLRGFDRPLATCTLSRFWGVDTGKTNGDLLPLTTCHSNCVANTN